MRLNDRSGRGAGGGWLRLYPRDWRDRYEAEMLAVLEARPACWRTRLDLARGALDAHVHPRTPPGVPRVTAVLGGIAWIVAGLASWVQPVRPDWPGYLLETLPLGFVGAIAAFRIVVAVGRRSGVEPPRGSDVALGLAVAGHAVWVVVLALAAVGGPYGAITGACQSIAAIGTVVVGLVRWRADDHPIAEAILVAGASMLVPSPAAWLVAGATWIALAVVVAHPPLRMRRV
jgi:hypothetical protein